MGPGNIQPSCKIDSTADPAVRCEMRLEEPRVLLLFGDPQSSPTRISDGDFRAWLTDLRTPCAPPALDLICVRLGSRSHLCLGHCLRTSSSIRSTTIAGQLSPLFNLDFSAASRGHAQHAEQSVDSDGKGIEDIGRSVLCEAFLLV